MSDVREGLTVFGTELQKAFDIHLQLMLTMSHSLGISF